MIIEANYNTLLVALSYVISVFGSFTALQLAIRIPASIGQAQNRWVIGAAIALGGCGIWSMHFIAMLAYDVPITISYQPILTILSLLISIAVVAVGFHLVGNGGSSFTTLIKGGVIAGLGVAAMHYLGMEAMIMDATIRWNTNIVILSVVIAITAATVALWLAFNLRGGLQRFGSAFVMGVAVCGMHYTGMSAVTLVANENSTSVTQIGASLSSQTLGFMVFFITIVLLIGFLIMVKKSAQQAQLEEDILFS